MPSAVRRPPRRCGLSCSTRPATQRHRRRSAPSPTASGLLTAYGAVRYTGVPAIGLVPFAVGPGRAAGFMAALSVLPGVRSVALDRVAHADATRIRTPRDPLLREQWALTRIHATQ